MAETVSRQDQIKLGTRTSNPHINYIDGIRALAALYVMTVHTNGRIPSGQPHGLVKMIVKFSAQGHLAVSIFILVSGFCLMLPVLKNNAQFKGGILRFFKKRSLRILPPLYIILVLDALALTLYTDPNTGKIYGLPALSHFLSMKVILSNLLLLIDVIPNANIPSTGVVWSVAVEWQIYFLFPFFLLLWRKMGAARSVVYIVGVAYLLAYLWRYTFLAGLTVQYFGLFALGMLAAKISSDGLTQELQKCKEKVPWILLAAMLFVGM